METRENWALLESTLRAFHFDPEACELIFDYGSGHINDTMKVHNHRDGEFYILQRINTYVFKNPEAMMANILKVTDTLRAEHAAGRFAQATMDFLRTTDGEAYFVDAESGYWRCYHLIGPALTYQKSEDLSSFKKSGEAFGAFMYSLRDFPSDELIETIPDFHNTPKRYQAFEEVLARDVHQRAVTCRAEIDFLKARQALCHELVDGLAAGRLPLRVTHNDTKLNNILFSCESGEALAIIDLDTVMPGLAAYDFGDSIRFGASTALEDERDLEKVHFSLPLFEAYADGYLSSLADELSIDELHSLAAGAKIITLETGMRFLTDYLDGDTYFKTDYPEHNLVRCRTQFKLVEEMEVKYSEMKASLEWLQALHRS
ncbi:MAG: phosphotransferase [Eubacteriales bacterium]|nr:phosphotransferase [Eubacteriales bacterium]